MHVNQGLLCSEEDLVNGKKVSWLTQKTVSSLIIGKNTIIDSPIDSQYIASIYWAVTTMTTVGYGVCTSLTDRSRSSV